MYWGVKKKLSLFSLLQIQEMEISRMKAERILREHKGNVVDALTELVN